MRIPLLSFKIALVVQNALFALSYQPSFHLRHVVQKPALASNSPLFRSCTSRSTISSRYEQSNFHVQKSSYFHLNSMNSDVTDEIASADIVAKQQEEEGIGAWIPVASINAMRGLGPQKITVMNTDLVIWHTAPAEDSDAEEEWIIQADACTHRLAPLSQGRVNPESNCIECPYHGWQFDTSGNVTSIPQLDKTTTLQNVQKSKGTKLQTFPTHAAGDLLFAFLPSSMHGEMFPQSILPEQFYPLLNDEKMKGSKYFARDLPYSFDLLVENFMDPAHIPFAHHKLQSTRDDGMPIEMAELESNFTHVKVSFKDMTRKRKRDAFAQFQRPSLYHFSERNGELNKETGEREGEWTPTLPIFVVPVKAGKSRLFLCTPKLKIPDWLLHAGSNRFLNSDIWLHDTERELVRRKESLSEASRKLCGMDYQYQSKSDLGVSAFRKWWRDNGMADSPPHTFGMATMEQLGPNALTRREQIDPWENHAKHCSICRKALVKMKKLQTASLFFALASVLFGSKKPIFGAIGAGIGVFFHGFFKKFATVIEGNPEASGIADRSAAASAA